MATNTNSNQHVSLVEGESWNDSSRIGCDGSPLPGITPKRFPNHVERVRVDAILVIPKGGESERRDNEERGEVVSG